MKAATESFVGALIHLGPEIRGGTNSMPQYEIHILQDEQLPSIILAEDAESDRAAIKSARAIAHCRQFEVWKGSECVTGVAHLLPPPTL
jgi:hypothetical protein